MADNETYQNFLTSLTVFDKVSDKNVKELLSLVDSSSEKTAKEAQDEAIEGSETLNKNNTNPSDLSSLSQKAMIINNKVATKAISPEVKTVTSSNYDVVKAKVEEYYDSNKDKLKSDILSMMKTTDSAVKNGFKIADYIKDIQDNLDEYNELNQVAAVDFSSNPKTWIQNVFDYLTGPAYNGDILLRTEDEETRKFLAEDFLEELAYDNSGLIDGGEWYRANNTIYRSGITIKQNPIKPLQIDNVNKVMKSYIKKLRGMKPGKLPVVGGKINLYGGDSPSGDTIQSYYEKHMNALLQQIAERKVSTTSVDFPAALEGTYPTPVPSYQKVQKHTVQGGAKGVHLEKEINKTNSQTSKNINRTYNNPFIKDMLAAGPDVFSNMFDIYMRFNRTPSHNIIKRDKSSDDSRITDGSKALDAKDYTSYVYFLPALQSKGTKGSFNNVASNPWISMMNEVYSFSVRNASVTIPMVTRSTSQMKFLNTEVERTTSQVTMNMEGSLSLDMDANTYMVDMFSALSGLQREGKYNDKGTITDRMSDFYNRLSGHYPFLAPAKLGWELSSVDLIVSSHALNGWYSNYYSPNGMGNVNNMLFVFEDVRFLGAGSDIKFSIESSNSQTCDVSFIAKDVKSYYKPDNLVFSTDDTDIVKRDMTFNFKNLKGDTYGEDTFSPSDAETAITTASNAGA